MTTAPITEPARSESLHPNERDLPFQSVDVRTPNGEIVCNTSGAFSQVPGRPDYFVGRGFGIGTLKYCHNPTDNPRSFIGLFKMDWSSHTLIFQDDILKPPLDTPLGLRLNKSYDPYVTNFEGEFWLGFECTAPGAVSVALVPLSSDLRSADLSRFSIPAIGTVGPHGPRNQIVALTSASAPTLLAYDGSLYLYWQFDPFDNDRADKILLTRGMKLEADSKGRFWGTGSNGQSVRTDDPGLTFAALAANPKDPTADHVALLSDLAISDNKIVAISSIGGTAGKQICRSTHEDSVGCFRVSVSLADAPTGENIFGRDVLDRLELPANGIEYPRLITDPEGRRLLLGNFIESKSPILNAQRVIYPVHGLGYIPFELKGSVR